MMDQDERKKMMIGVGGFLAVGGFVTLAQQAPQLIIPSPRPTPVDVRPAPDLESGTAERDKEAVISSGEHCLSSWDGSLPALKDAVKRQLRNPHSFEHVETVRSPVDKKGTFGLIMTYRAENGFGGMNLEAVGVEVDAETCRFKHASNASLARRLGNTG